MSDEREQASRAAKNLKGTSAYKDREWSRLSAYEKAQRPKEAKKRSVAKKMGVKKHLNAMDRMFSDAKPHGRYKIVKKPTMRSGTKFVRYSNEPSKSKRHLSVQNHEE